MERLTEKITNKETGEILAYRTLPNVTNLKAIQQLGKYEDTGLTPEQVQELKERDTAKKPIKTKGLKDFNGNIYKVVGKCPNCGCDVSNRMRFCDECGQRLKWEE